MNMPHPTEELLSRIMITLEEDLADYARLIELTKMLKENTNGEYQENASIENDPRFKQRDDRFHGLVIRAEKLQIMQDEFCRHLNIEAFSLKNLEEKISSIDFELLSKIMSQLSTSMAVLLELNAELKHILEPELEGTKLEIHRLQGGRRLRQAYEVQDVSEARFIDKKK